MWISIEVAVVTWMGILVWAGAFTEIASPCERAKMTYRPEHAATNPGTRCKIFASVSTGNGRCLGVGHVVACEFKDSAICWL